METGALGKAYQDGEVIIRQGDDGGCMFVVQQGEVEVIRETGDQGIRLAVLKAGDFFGEMSIFEREVRAATVKALGETRVLTVDKKGFLRRINEDPSLAFRLVQTMSRRIRELNAEVARLRSKEG